MKAAGPSSDSAHKAAVDDPVWRRLVARFVRGLSDLLEASEPKRKRPRNLYIRGMSSHGLVTRRYGE